MIIDIFRLSISPSTRSPTFMVAFLAQNRCHISPNLSLTLVPLGDKKWLTRNSSALITLNSVNSDKIFAGYSLRSLGVISLNILREPVTEYPQSMHQQGTFVQ